ncbi:hypothetical protein ACFWMG_27990 [Streptomyces sp. NPDC127074]|uniref:RraA family protein n=1 Tax=Streptomyces sp. NPDC127074 TaxID=3347130 RepID=UPI0036469A47
MPVTARGRLRQKSTGEPVPVGDVTVRPGDVVMADEGGVVVVPRERATEVLGAARRIAGREAAIEVEVRPIEAEARSGVPLPGAMRDARLAGTETAMTAPEDAPATTGVTTQVDPADTRYAATVLAAWAGRYVLSPTPLGERVNRD